MFVTGTGEKEQERTGKDRTNRTLQAVDIATKCGESIAITSVVKNGVFSLLISGPFNSTQSSFVGIFVNCSSQSARFMIGCLRVVSGSCWRGLLLKAQMGDRLGIPRLATRQR